MRETSRINHHRLILVLLSIAPALALAQTDAASPNPAAKDKEDVLVLSPFVVQSGEGESGYASELTTSGSRLKTSLKDVAASVSVLTNDFMNDLGATDVASAMALVSGAETDKTFHNESVLALGGPNGYVGGDFGDNNNRSGYIRVRGLGKASTTQNFIEVIGSTDRYNTDRTEFLRGANSILFGLAEPAGLVNSSTKVANLRRNSTSLENKIDNHGSMRWVLDHSHVLIRNKLALRLVGLNTEQRYEVETARSRDQRLFLTAAFRPFKNTTLTANYERQNAWGRRPNYRTVQDNVTDWLTKYNAYAPQMTQAQIDAAFFWDPASTAQRGTAATSSAFTLANGTAVDLGIIRRPLDTRANGTTLIYNGNGQSVDPLDNLVTLMANRTITGGNASPTTTIQQFMRSGSARENEPTFLADPQVTDEGIFPYSTVELAALPGAYRSEYDTKYYVNLDQRITDNLYFSASFQHEGWNQEQYFPILTQTNQISIDITKTLPDGRVNPNFLRPFVYGRNIGEYNDKSLDSFVVQANYDFDFAKKTRKLGWLGSHRFTTVYTHSRQESQGYRWNYQWDNDVPVGLAAANYSQGNNPNRWIMQMWYVGDKVQVGDTALRYTGFPASTNAQWDRSYDLRFFNNTAVPAAWQTASAKVHAGRQVLPGTGINSWQVNEGVGTSLQSYFLKKRLVTLFGWRRDTVDSYQGIPLAPTLAMFPTVPGAFPADFPTGTSYSNRADTTTQSAVYKFNDKFRVFATRSENFAATAPRQDNLYRTIAAPNGVTKDFGVGLTVLDGRLDVRYTHFSSAQKNATSNTGVASIRIVAFEASLYNALLAANRLAEWSTVAPGGGTTTQQYVNPSNAASSMDLESEGDSIEVNFRPNQHWDFAGSVDRLENVSTRVGTEVMDFLDVRAPFYKKYFDEGLRLDGTTTSTSTLLSSSFTSTIASNYVNELVARGTSNRGISEYTAKLVARYKFLEGRLKGLSVGANVRWESGKIIGYGQQAATFNFGGLQNVSGLVYNPAVQYKGPEIIAGGLMASYQRKIYKGKINWRIQLNAQNLFDKTGLVVFAANPNGSPIYAYNPGRAFELTNTFSF